MRIAIDARFANLKVGIGRVAYSLTKELLLIDDENQYIVLLGKDDPFEDINKKNVKKIRNAFSTKKKLTWQFIYLPYILKKEKVDIFLSTENFIIPPFFKGKTILTIHDLIPIVFKEYLQNKISPYKFKVFMSKIFPPEKIMTVSKFSKDEIKRILQIPDNKIFIIKEALDKRLKDISNDNEIIKNFDIEKPYILGIGGMELRKNNKTLISAFIDMIEENSELKHNLVIIGKLYSKKIPMDERKVPEHLKERIRFLGEVSDKELSVLYKNADMFVYPSIYEGFGLPPLEAFRHKIPVITSEITSIPEATKDGAILINPYEKDEIKDAMIKVIRNENLRKELIKKGTKVLKDFDWNKSAQKLLKEIKKIHGEKR
jgi:glycosyltransferase involved in cell wall biosynthesis